jgi:hypothetical protein
VFRQNCSSTYISFTSTSQSTQASKSKIHLQKHQIFGYNNIKMRFSSISLLTLVGSAIAAPAILEPRDDSIVRYNIKRVYTLLQSLDTNFNKKPRTNANVNTIDGFVNNVLSIQSSLISELRAGADDIRRSRAKVTTLEAVGLTPTLSDHDRLTTDVVNGWIDIKPLVIKVRRQPEVLSSLISAQIELNNFSDAMIVSLPSGSQTFGTSLKSRLSTNLDRAIREFRGR